jgi:hypothetical protein
VRARFSPAAWRNRRVRPCRSSERVGEEPPPGDAEWWCPGTGPSPCGPTSLANGVAAVQAPKATSSQPSARRRLAVSHWLPRPDAQASPTMAGAVPSPNTAMNTAPSSAPPLPAAAASMPYTSPQGSQPHNAPSASAWPACRGGTKCRAAGASLRHRPAPAASSGASSRRLSATCRPSSTSTRPMSNRSHGPIPAAPARPAPIAPATAPAAA